MVVEGRLPSCAQRENEKIYQEENEVITCSGRSIGFNFMTLLISSTVLVFYVDAFSTPIQGRNIMASAGTREKCIKNVVYIYRGFFSVSLFSVLKLFPFLCSREESGEHEVKREGERTSEIWLFSKFRGRRFQKCTLILKWRLLRNFLSILILQFFSETWATCSCFVFCRCFLMRM